MKRYDIHDLIVKDNESIFISLIQINNVYKYEYIKVNKTIKLNEVKLHRLMFDTSLKLKFIDIKPITENEYIATDIIFSDKKFLTN